MKYSIVLSVTETKFGPIVFKGNLFKNLEEIKKLEYDGVELVIRNPESIDIVKTKNIIDSFGLTPAALATVQIYADEGLSFSDSDKKVREKAVEKMKSVIDIATYFDCNVVIGLVRGKINQTDNYAKEIKIAEKRICNCLKKCLNYSKGSNVNFLIEPINRYETNIFNRLEDVYNFLTKYDNVLDSTRIGILADCFHMNIEEPIIDESIYRYSKLIKHMHFADSNRLAPGYGHIDFNRIIGVLKKIKYTGFISFEMLPLPDPITSAKKGIEFIKNLF